MAATPAPVEAPPATPPTCGKSVYAITIPGLNYGMSVEAATAVMKSQYPEAGMTTEGGRLAFLFIDPPHPTYDFISLHSRNGTIYQIDISYSNSFIEQLGGYQPAVFALMKKAVDKYGKASDLSNEDDRMEVSWAKNEGAEFRVRAQTPSTVLLNYACTDLDGYLRDKALTETNFGF